jgi:hypothetical protein
MAAQLVPYALQGEPGIGKGHPTLPDTINRALIFILQKCGLNPDAVFSGLAPVYHVRAYGAVGDGVTDDTAAIQAALNAAGGSTVAVTDAATVLAGIGGGVSDSGLPALAASGGEVLLDRGQYKITSTLYVPANCVLRGQGRGSVIYHTGAGKGIAFVRPQGDGYAFRTTLKNFLLWGTNAGVGQHGIYIQYAHSFHLENIRVENCGGTGLWINNNTVGGNLYNVTGRDNGLEQLFFDGNNGGVYLNSDSHSVHGGVFWTNSRGTHSIRIRASEDIALYHPILSGNNTNIALQLEGCKKTQMFGAFSEYHGYHLKVLADAQTGRRAERNYIRGGDWEGGPGSKMNVSIDGATETVLDGVIANAPSPNATERSIITISATAVDTVIRGRFPFHGLTDAGKSTRLDDFVTDGKGVTGTPVASTNYVGFSTRLASGSWQAGAGITSRTEGQTGPLPGVPATRIVAGAGGSNNYVQYNSTAIASLGTMVALSFWARATAETYMSANLAVPGVGDEIDQLVSLGTSWKRYVVQGPIGVLTGNIAPTFLLQNGTTVDIAGVQCEIGGATPYKHTYTNATFSAQNGDSQRTGRLFERLADLTDGATVTIDEATGDYLKAALGGSRTFGVPANRVQGSRFRVEVKNNTAGAIVTTWNAVFKLAGAWVDPAAGKRRIVEFLDDGTDLVEQARSPADIS